MNSWLNLTMNKCKVIFLSIVFVVVMGCTTVPQKYESLQSTEQHWEQNTPSLQEKSIQKIAIAEFNVELVTGKYENFFSESQFKVPILDTIPLTRLMGVGRRVVKLDPEKHKQLCDDMYSAYTKMLEEKGFDVIPHTQVTAANNYKKFETEESLSSSFLKRFNPISSDTGCVKSYRVLPTTGLRIISGGNEQEHEVEEALRNEIGADILLRANFRVGIFRNFATIESGSVTHITGKNFRGDANIPRSIVSDKKVVEDTYTHLGGKTVVTLNYDKYSQSIHEMFPRVVTSVLQKRTEILASAVDR